jgi:aerobic carbon-monoxide dehydrogenase medium subunit
VRDLYASPFEYLAASSWEEALQLLAAHSDAQPRVIAGGQSLAPMMNLRLAEPSHLIDLNGIPAEAIRRDGDVLVIPALIRHHELGASELAGADAPVFAEAAPLIGNVRVRHRGTIGGSFAHADPSAELPCAALVSDASVVALGPGGSRTIPVSEFFQSYFTTALGPDELVREIRVPVAPPGSGWSFHEFGRRTGDFAVVEVGVIVRFDASGACTGARVAVGGVSDTPLLLPELEAIVREDRTENGIAAAASRASSLVDPVGNEYASAEYRRHLTGVLVRRALRQAVERGEAGTR